MRDFSYIGFNSLGKLAPTKTKTKGFIYAYNTTEHLVGISYKSQPTSTIPSIVIDGYHYDLLPNNVYTKSNNYKIANTEVVIESGVWKLKITVYIDGVYYYKYLNFDK